MRFSVGSLSEAAARTLQGLCELLAVVPAEFVPVAHTVSAFELVSAAGSFPLLAWLLFRPGSVLALVCRTG